MPCTICGDIGLVKTERGSVPCECQVAAAEKVRIRRARIPAGFEHATLENLEAKPHLRQALLLARRYVEEFCPANNRVTDKEQPGLLLTGSVGTGKTHIAVGIVRAIAGRGFQPLFVDVRELLERLRSSYDNDAQESQAQILAPIFRAHLVAIDELGAARPTDWMFDTIELLIGGLYNRMIPTIVTTNLKNLGIGAETRNEYERVARQETLGDRIGARMFSRLQQMCRTIDTTGPDWRAARR